MARGAIAEKPITRVADGLWCLESHFVTCGCKGSLRMTMIETARGLVLHSPVALSARHIEEIRAIGPVHAIVAPNLYHHFYLRDGIAAFPDARVLVPQGLAEKIGPIPGATVMRPGLDLALEGVESYSFTGHWLNETVLFHRPSGTLITADMVYNYRSEHFVFERLFFRLIGCYGKPGVALYHWFATPDKHAVWQGIETIRAWPIRRIIMSHGRIFEADNAGDVFASAWRTLLQPASSRSTNSGTSSVAGP
ncbi:MAG: hypothetical protein ACXU8U_00850 [Asticcacaulis sp.]